MKPFEESDRYNYDLTPASLVVDGGGFEGNWANLIAQRYGCQVVCYEPTLAFHRNIIHRVANREISDRIMAVNAGLGCDNRTERFGVKGYLTGIACDGNHEENVRILDVAACLQGWMAGFNRPRVDLLKLNIEGMEYEVLERLIDTGLIRRVQHLQVQFHACVPDFQSRHNRIVQQLAATHEHVYGEPFCWDGFSLK